MRSTPTSLSRHALARGFTLLEMMGVLVIIGLIMSLVIVNVVGQGDAARRATTVTMLKQVSSQLKSYNLTYGAYPPKLDNLVPKYLEKFPADAWQRPLYYYVNPPGSPHPYNLYSTAASGEQGNPDNIDLWIEDAAKPN